jgi:predicted lipoprotein with Yx(FWY)xxD motif
METSNWERDMASRRTAKFGAAALAISAVVLAGCGSSSSSSSSGATAAAAPTSASSTTSAAPAAAAITIGTTQGKDGTYLTGTNGRAIYLWVADSGGKSACSGACAHAWPPVEGTPSAGAGVTASDLATITRSDGSKQVTYNGHPLYYFIADTSKGDTKGQGTNGFGAKWWLVAPSGSALSVAAANKSSGSSSGYSTSSSSGGWG